MTDPFPTSRSMIVAMKETTKLGHLDEFGRAGKFDRLYIIGKKLGKGGFGTVFSATQISDNKSVALKFIPVSNIQHWIEQGDGTKLPSEVVMMKRVHHIPGVPFLLDVFHSPVIYVLVMYRPPSPHLDLYTYSITYYVFEYEARDIMRELIDIVIQVQDAGVFHADLKCSNVVISKKFLASKSIYLVDFGSARMLKDGLYEGTTGCHMGFSREMLTEGFYRAESFTVWALGILVYRLVTGRGPYKTKEQIRDPTHLQIPDKCSLELKDFIERCLKHDPLQRPTLRHLAKHPWLERRVGHWWRSIVNRRRDPLNDFANLTLRTNDEEIREEQIS